MQRRSDSAAIAAQQRGSALSRRGDLVRCSRRVFSTILLLAALVLLGLKFGLRERLREIGRTLDRLVNLLLVLIVVAYGVQVIFIALNR
jgi:hypothetical protein